MENVKTFGTLVLTIIAVLILAPVALALNGWAVSTLWGWFIVPLFGLPALTIPYAIGLCIVVAVIRPVPGKPKSKESAIAGLTAIFAAPLMGVALGWIVKSFI